MSTARRFFARVAATIRSLAGSSSDDDDLRAELDAHLDFETAEHIRRGLAPADARRAAMLASGGLAIAAEQARASRGFAGVESLLADVRHAARGLVTRPAYTVAVISTLALGIGVNAAMFAIVNAVVLRPLPYPEPERIVSVSMMGVTRNSAPVDAGVVEEGTYFAWAAAARTVSLAAYGSGTSVIEGPNGGEEVPTTQGTRHYFDVFRPVVIAGRLFSDADELVSAPAVVVLNEALWTRAFHGDRSVIGRTVTIDGRPVTVIGVARLAGRAQCWTPYRIAPSTGITFFYSVVGRIAPGQTIEAVRSELSTIALRTNPKAPPVVVMTLHDRRFGDRTRPLTILFVAVSVLLLIACSNVASLALARASTRSREIAVRLALGASSARIAQGMLAESLLVSFAGAVVGLGVAVGSVRLAVHLSPEAVGNLETIDLGAPTLAFVFLLALGVGVAFGLGPAVASIRRASGGAPGLSESRASLGTASRSAGSRRSRSMRRTLVAAQLATALVLLVVAGIVAKTFIRLTSIPLGMRTDVYNVSVLLPRFRYSTANASRFFDDLRVRVQAIPGVESAALTNVSPLGGFAMTIAGSSVSGGMQSAPIGTVGVGPGYFATLGIPIRSGRPITEDDDASAQPTIVINEGLARALGPRAVAGATIQFHGAPTRIVGIVPDVRQAGIEESTWPVAYLPLSQDSSRYQRLLIATAPGSADPTATVAGIVRDMDRSLGASRIQRLDATVADVLAPRRFNFLLLGGFAVLAVTLAMVGLYGVLAQLVAARTREIGVRIALGADAPRIRRLVVGEAVTIAGAGAVVGLALSAVAVRGARSMMYETSVYDPAAFVGAALALVAVCAVATYAPVRRASRVDPMVALRVD